MKYEINNCGIIDKNIIQRYIRYLRLERGYSSNTLDASNTYQTYSLPTTYFIDAQGNIIARATGAIDSDILQQGIDMITQ